MTTTTYAFANTDRTTWDVSVAIMTYEVVETANAIGGGTHYRAASTVLSTTYYESMEIAVDVAAAHNNGESVTNLRAAARAEAAARAAHLNSVRAEQDAMARQ
jgi:hypothetical protein